MDIELLVGIFPQVLLDGILLGFMYALIALGYTMVYGVLEFINFAHSEIFIFGAFVGVEILLSMQSAGWLERLPWVVVLLIVLLVGMLASGLLAVTVERVAYRPLRHAPRLIPLISAIGVSFFLQDVIRFFESIWRNAFNLVYPTMEVMNHRFELTETIDVSVRSLVVIVAALLMLWGLHVLVNRTKIGTAIRAVAEDQAAASLMGINVNRIISMTFLIGGAMGGAAGVLFGIQYSLINPYTGFIPGLKAFTAAVLGGIGNIPGAMMGGIVLGLLEAFAASYLSLLSGGAFGAEYKDIFAFSILILILIFRPKGLLCEIVRDGDRHRRPRPARPVGIGHRARRAAPRRERVWHHPLPTLDPGVHGLRGRHPPPLSGPDAPLAQGSARRPHPWRADAVRGLDQPLLSGDRRAGRHLRGARARPQHRRRPGRPPRPRLRRVLRSGRLLVGDLRLAPGQPDLRRELLSAFRVVVLRLPARRGGRGGGHGDPAGP